MSGTGDLQPPAGATALEGPRRRRRGLRITAWVAAGLVLVGAGGAGYIYFRLNGNIHSVDIDSALGADRPVKLGNGSMDILVLGSDSRSGANRGYGHDSGTARSDTAMIVHLAKGHKRASVVSIPRDTLISRPACKKPGGGTAPAVPQAMFNSAYEVGGPVCAVKTVEALTGLRMDHYVEVDFTGFKDLVNALGGVPLTTTSAIDDTKSHLTLAAGTHTLDGDQALGLVRTRHGVADGSDLGRIQLQQAFLKALMDRISGLGVLTSPTKLFSVADTATSAVTTDTGLGSVGRLMGLAQSVRNLKSGHIHMVTLPVRYAPTDRNRVEPIEAKAQMVWAALRADKAIPAAAVQGSAADKVDAGKVVRPSPSATPSKGR
ncbi:LCP family protein [Actinacidiphila bryophytorum]|uniref:Transcriptional attenuator, LytR family n=1 Tax=Actinacidiphila bryophytorum TaxID=1436133 RepID=A0A9W4GXD7_9ACTN|nr:LCP family protein [Actinacidiphila bryophytorum]MBM9435354.1 LCP family protein [Actinacidiphila bryophytorum]MBN6544363.1 LCP family protein [Actinacidiphila bryophytorum]CAG7607169.1 Transcriptional attenuator, LytR family [Actinacidiphila bryophytorum]